MNATERNITAAPGPSFFRDEDGTVMFQFVLDSASIVGPRPASKRDISEHAEAYRIFSVSEPEEDLAVALAPVPAEASFNGADPAKFDHDGDGEPGGSKPKTRRKGKSAK